MSRTINTAIILSAGFGTRLRPLTLTVPKPLIDLGPMLLIDHQINYLASFGITKIVINLHYLGEKISAHCGDGSRYGVQIAYSNEAQILGTGGGIKNADHLLGSAPFIALNSDALIATDIDALIDRHLSSETLATLSLKKLGPDDKFTPVGINPNGSINSFGRGDYLFTGLQVIDPKLLVSLPPKGIKSCIVRDGYIPMIERGESIASYIYDGYSNDLGTNERYRQALIDISAGRFKITAYNCKKPFKTK